MDDPRASLTARLRGSGAFGFGGSSLGNLYREMTDEQAVAAVDAGWDAGIRYFDTAPFYGFGLSERRLGAALRRRPRDAFLLSTKVGRRLVPAPGAGTAHGFVRALPFDPVFDYSYDGVMRSFEDSLDRLDVARVDVLLMHDLGAATHGADHARHFGDAVAGGFRAMTALRDQGAVGAIGLGVNEIAVCEDSLSRADLDVVLLAGRYTLLDRSAAAFLDRCDGRGIGVVAAGVFNSGILATGTAGGGPLRYDYAPAPPDVVARVAAVERVCAAWCVPLAAAAQQFVRTHPAVSQILLGVRSAAEVAAGLSQAERRIPPAFWQALREADAIGVAPPQVVG